MKLKVALILVVLALLIPGCSGEIFSGNTGNAEPGRVENEQSGQIPEGESDNNVEEGYGFDLSDDFDLSNIPGLESLDERFTAGEAIYRAEQITAALESFRLLTETVKEKISQQELTEIGNTSWEIQYLGFHNWTGTITGTLIRQDYEIKKLDLQLAGKRFEAGELDKEELKLKEAAYLEAKNRVRQFLESYQIAD